METEEIGKIDNEKIIIDDGVEKSAGMLKKERARNKSIFVAFVSLSLFVGYWSIGAGVPSVIAIVFLVFPISVFAFVFYSKVRSNNRFINKLEINMEDGEADAVAVTLNTNFVIPEYIKPSSPLFAWILSWVTGGFYMFVWLYQMMMNINLIWGRPVFRTGKIFLIAFLIIASLVLLLMYAPEVSGVEVGKSASLKTVVTALFVLIVLFWFGGLIYLQVKLSKYIRLLQVAKGVNDRASAGDTVLFFFMFYASVPYVQSQFNSVVEKNAPNKHN